jgi:hypothetical protein
MSKKILFLLFAFLWLHATTSHATAFHPTNAAVRMEDNCNLPGPSNLTNTGATTTSLSFAWDPVPGRDRYEVLLSEVVTGDPIYSGPEFSESLTIGGLNPDTEYELKVWSVCPNGALGGYSAIIAHTDYVIVEDIITTRQFNNEVLGNNFPLYADDLSPQPNELFKIKAPNGKSTLFESEKNTTPVQNALYVHRLEFNHENGTLEQREEWILGVTDTDAPFGGPGKKQNMDVVNVYHKRDTRHEHVMIMWCSRDDSDNSSILGWAPLVSGYELVKSVGPGFEGGQGPGNRSNMADLEKGITVGPNPFQDNLVLRTQDNQTEKANISMIEPISGRVLFQIKYAGGQISLPVAHLSAGSYIVRYESPTATQSFKVIKTN